MEAIVLAGGLGTRLRAAVPDLPKPMAPVAGRPFLEWLLDRWIAQGIERFVLSVGYRADAIRSHFGARYGGAAIDYAIESSPLGTGGGLLLGAARLEGDGPFVVLNGDTLLDVELRALSSFHKERGADLTIALIRNAEGDRYGGILADADGRISGFGIKGAPQANGGVYLFEPRLLDGRAGGGPLSLESELLPSLIAKGARVYGMATTGGFLDIGVPEDYARAEAFLAAGKKERRSE